MLLSGNRLFRPISLSSKLLQCFADISSVQKLSPSLSQYQLICYQKSSGFSTADKPNTIKMGDNDSIYNLTYTSIDGTTESMEKYKGHVLIVVNTASKCGYTCVNYEQLTELYDKYAESEGLRILAFPCNQFMNEEPLGEKEIKEFAATYNVRYDMSSKVDVNGANTHPVWAYMKKKQGGLLGDFVKWNFTKFVVDKKGNVVKRYGPTTNPRELEKDLLEYFKQEA